MAKTNKLTDIQKLLIALQCDKFKFLKGGKCVEIKVNDLDGQKKVAQSIIDSKNLDLRIVSDGYMAVYRAFEVWEGRE